MFNPPGMKKGKSLWGKNHFHGSESQSFDKDTKKCRKDLFLTDLLWEGQDSKCLICITSCSSQSCSLNLMPLNK